MGKKTRAEIEYKIIAEELEKVGQEDYRRAVEIISVRRVELESISSECDKIVDPGYVDTEGYIHFKVDHAAPVEIVCHLIRGYLDRYGKRTKTRFRPEPIIEGLQIKEAHEKEGKSLLQIARERSGRNGNPSTDEFVKAEYEKVKRYYGRVKNLQL